MRARIYRPSKNPMQSGRGTTRRWVLEFEPATAKPVDKLMGWTGSLDTQEQVRMCFDTADAAVRYATRAGLEYSLVKTPERPFVAKSYAANFDRNIKVPWSH